VANISKAVKRILTAPPPTFREIEEDQEAWKGLLYLMEHRRELKIVLAEKNNKKFMFSHMGYIMQIGNQFRRLNRCEMLEELRKCCPGAKIDEKKIVAAVLKKVKEVFT
jgi:hypothetical protein